MNGPAESPLELPDLVRLSIAALGEGRRRRGGPLPDGGPSRVHADVLAALGAPPDRPSAPPKQTETPPDRTGAPPDRAGLLPAEGIGAAASLTALVTALAAGSVDPADPWCAGHLHCPPLAVAIAADLAVSALNPSLDSWDQGPAAMTVEAEVIAALAALVGFDPRLATGTITTGGSESNLLGLLLARDAAASSASADTASANARPTSLELTAQRADAGGAPLRVFRSSAAHLSVDRAAAVLGLHGLPVAEIATDERDRMRVDLLRQALANHDGPAVVVATAGTTDAGAVDPLPQIAAAVEEHRRRPWGHMGQMNHPDASASSLHRAWLHVDAAYGGGALFSPRLAGLLAGITLADSVALDLHKWGWQPAPAGVFLTPRPDGWPSLRVAQADYLRADDDEQAGYPSLLDRSLRTTRRPDSFPIAVTFRALGRRELAARVDICHDLALHAERTVRADPRLELAHPVTLSTIVFRYRPASADLDDLGCVDELNARIRRALLQGGRAVVGRTRAGPERAVHLKLTLLNPDATPADVSALVSLIAATGDHLARPDHSEHADPPHNRSIA
ncbi:L-2,4-diaminobutyrate decarboxylase [Frankia sp. AiPs1]|uniref:pyridoxal phosphate-dependent decarboxylase family protein n=1 Tax=Frankia sp. AiPa1 TaxID=573492 RepID=UPI00202AEA02|nr:pyridoxal-dependent decarboxylase [Frankia sp. AiPa1]MCL9759352.1 pyridoxal-dependent decarboxylase [Frankia sp. AiPa1]